ncbi:lysophospholipid acyltransferase 1 [Vairimorpha necatrix]|uniref:Lysophospholipid acyltransferase 1 n=1 Tax=Vairimorpha necatrix TaxID=6039 RepID=A0AAX4JA27_9MICR
MIKYLLTHLTTSELRFLLALFLTVFFSLTLKQRKGMIHTTCAFIILYIAFGYFQLIYFSTAVILNFSLVAVFRLEEYSLTVINLAILYFFKIKGEDFDSQIEGTCDVSGILMLLTIKMSYLGKEFDMKKHAFSDFMGYIYFVPGLILGPVSSFKSYIESPQIQNLPCLRSFLISLVFLIVSKLGENFFPVKNLYLKNISIWKRLLNIYGYNFRQRCRFYFAWNFSNGCFLIQGFKDMLNINFILVETATSIKDLSMGWNIYTNKWLKECYFDKLKHRNVFLASLVTFTVSAMWHGIKPGYLIMFLSFCFAIPVIKGINKIILKHAPILYPVLSRIQMVFFVMYFSLPFFLLEVHKIIQVWSSVYFYGHIYCGVGLVLFALHSLYK